MLTLHGLAVESAAMKRSDAGMNVVLVGSAGRCGIYEYSQMLLEGFRQIGHRAHYIGVRNKDNRDLSRQLRQVSAEDEVVIFEYEPGIFQLRGLVAQMCRLRFQGKQVLLSVHEIGPAKYGEYHYILDRLSQPVRCRGPLELVRLVWATLGVAYRYLTLRVFLVLLGWLPHHVIIHSPKAEAHIGIALANRRKLRYVPLVVKQLEGDRDTLREQLGLPQDVFAFIIPGFLFRRKRIIEVMKQLPADVELWIVGTPSEYDPGYLEEIEAHLAHSRKREQVRLIQDYDRMEQYLLAADAVVLFYADAYQSAIASLAVGAGKPCIFSDLPAFSDLRGAGLVVRTPGELRQAMEEIQQRGTFAALQAEATQVRRDLHPSRIAARYVQMLA
jgi:glycosyltransferase involved in cell wall biosynthesis